MHILLCNNNNNYYYEDDDDDDCNCYYDKNKDQKLQKRTLGKIKGQEADAEP